ncbi:MAG TPA: choice-of-anchor tandem repeat GloVer-containing protein, partial [Candidatus Sulfotelmatobacter sp.]|nr:choice-of-anchor tandem repeat GloVer-containing protein [Candidatus Sulfotelmatobacter sp.]
ITPTGTLTTLYTFCSKPGCTDGRYPNGGLIQATDGNFYGTTSAGGDQSIANCTYQGCGTIFEITPTGAFSTLHTFVSTDGQNPYAGLLQRTDGTFYGTTNAGGSNGCNRGCGTVFSLSTGLGPFVKLTRDWGKAGQVGGILGQGFTGTTGVFLNGTPASFMGISDTHILATVPTGATSGFITVTTPSGTLTSNVVFRVTP